jgi:hypothetical protein
VLLVAALVAVLAACGSSHQAAPPPPKPKPKKPKPVPPVSRGLAPLVVTILDGDRRVRVPGAHVSLWGKRGRTDKHGVTTIEGPRKRLLVRVEAKGYTPATVRLNFQRRR